MSIEKPWLSDRSSSSKECNVASDELEKELIHFNAAVAGAATILADHHGLDLQANEIQNALCLSLEIDPMRPDKLLDKQLSTDEIVDLLSAYDFTIDRPELLTEVTLEEGVIPENVPRSLTEKTVKVKGEVWRVHQNDADPWPSSPHAHNIESGLVLHLGSGALYSPNRNFVANIGRKKLHAVREKLGDMPLPPLDE